MAAARRWRTACTPSSGELLGQRAPRPYHVVVNGWYFYSINWVSPAAFARNLPGMLWHLIRSRGRSPGSSRRPFDTAFRSSSGSGARTSSPATGRRSPRPKAAWRRCRSPSYPALIDELADLAGEYFASIAALTGAAYKMEMNLAAVLSPPPGAARSAAAICRCSPASSRRPTRTATRWCRSIGGTRPRRSRRRRRAAGDHARVVEARQAAEAAAFAVLASSPRRLRAFQQLLADTQHLVPMREEQARELTIAVAGHAAGSPAHRRGAGRAGVIAEPDDVFFLTRDEALAALAASRAAPRRRRRAPGDAGGAGAARGPAARSGA